MTMVFSQNVVTSAISSAGNEAHNPFPTLFGGTYSIVEGLLEPPGEHISAQDFSTGREGAPGVQVADLGGEGP